MEDTVKEKVDPDYNAVMEERRRVFADDFVEITHTLGVMWQKLKKIRDCGWDTSLRDQCGDVKDLVRVTYFHALSTENDRQLKRYMNRNTCLEVSELMDDLSMEMEKDSEKSKIEAKEELVKPYQEKPISKDIDGNDVYVGDLVIIHDHSIEVLCKMVDVPTTHKAIVIKTINNDLPEFMYTETFDENYYLKKLDVYDALFRCGENGVKA